MYTRDVLDFDKHCLLHAEMGYVNLATSPDVKIYLKNDLNVSHMKKLFHMESDHQGRKKSTNLFSPNGLIQLILQYYAHTNTDPQFTYWYCIYCNQNYLTILCYYSPSIHKFSTLVSSLALIKPNENTTSSTKPIIITWTLWFCA